jgi:hypothetical protein
LRHLLQSGFWVVAAALVVTLAVLLPHLGDGRVTARHGDGREATSYGFDLSAATVPATEVIASGMERDGLRALDDPITVAVAELDRVRVSRHSPLLVASDRVVGLVVDGEARAYPLLILRWHEVVNDTVRGRPVLISYSPLTDSVVVADRRVAAEELRFGVSGLLVDSNTLLYDRRPELGRSSLWRQLDAEAVSGPLAGARLELLPAALVPWGEWLRLHPDTRVLAPQPSMASRYRRDPYSSYMGSDLLRFPVDPLPPTGRLHLKDRVVVVEVDGSTAVIPLPDLAARAGAPRGEVELTLAGVPLRLQFDRDLGTARVDLPTGVRNRVAVRHAFWFAWYAAHPDRAPLPLPAG